MSQKTVIVGRAHTGKNRLAETLSGRFGLKMLKTSTDRPRRYPGEDSYHFYAKEESVRIPMDRKLFYTEAVDGHARWTGLLDFLEADIAILDVPGACQAVRLWQAQGHSVRVIYVMADDKARLDSWARDIAENGGDAGSARDLFDQREAVEAAMFDAVEQKIHDDDAAAASDGILYPNAPSAGPTLLFGADETDIWVNTFEPEAMQAFVGRTGHKILQYGPGRGGYRKFDNREPIILEPEDWTESEWAALMKLLGLDPAITTRAVLQMQAVECYIEPDAKNTYKDVCLNGTHPDNTFNKCRHLAAHTHTHRR